MEAKRVRSDEARRTFRALLNEVEHQGAHVTVLRYDTPAAVLVPVSWYEAAAERIEETASTAPDCATNVRQGGRNDR
jgi:prevent-host-death family protein